MWICSVAPLPLNEQKPPIFQLMLNERNEYALQSSDLTNKNIKILLTQQELDKTNWINHNHATKTDKTSISLDRY